MSERPIPDPRFQRYREAYLTMAPFYRPQAPGDGMGNVCLSREQVDDLGRLDRETSAYAIGFDKEENNRSFNIGCSNFETNRAFIWTIEAARCRLAGGADDVALKLLKLAVADVKSSQPRRKRKRAA